MEYERRYIVARDIDEEDRESFYVVIRTIDPVSGPFKTITEAREAMQRHKAADVRRAR